jgi:two-component system, NtrC family, C4-dicarboxylate transport sensor histidine kinase DctB
MTPRRVFLVFLGVALLAAVLAFGLARRWGEEAQQASLDQGLILTRRAVEAEIERFRYLPDVAGEDIRIQAALTAPDDPGAVQTANLYLETVAAKSGAAQLYLLDATGLAIAASNWSRPGSFVGQDYNFRPYYQGAITRGHGRFYAIGVTTGEPGYFLSSRVGGARATGVIVVKVDLQPLQQIWRAAGAATALADADGVVFLAGPADWLYRPLAPLPGRVLERLARERTYVGTDLAAAVPLLPPGDAATAASLELPDAGGPLLARQIAVTGEGWRVISGLPMAQVTHAAALWALAAALVAMAGTGLAMIAHQRRQILRLRLRQGALLERRVAERTRDLAHEIEARRKTEEDLRAAQEGLIHAEKMAALGRMSAAIVHEVSQPLAAMEAVLAAAELSMPAVGGEKSQGRIATARGHIRRLQRSIKHLKSFSRKAPAVLEPVDLRQVTENALDLVAPRAKVVGIWPGIGPGSPVRVRAGMVRMEQVMVNLLLNALDAVEGQAAGQVMVTLTAGEVAMIRVRDNGMGIAPQDLARVAEPFFSTKLTGGGLGLGLSISQAIVGEFGGRLEIASVEGQGTEVTVSLPLAQSEGPSGGPSEAVSEAAVHGSAAQDHADIGAASRPAHPADPGAAA